VLEGGGGGRDKERGLGGGHGEKVFTFCRLEKYDFSTCKGFL